jgi:hypothetical protein
MRRVPLVTIIVPLNWKIGQRVSRKDTGEEGTIIEIKDNYKVKWDGDRTSYYERGKPGNVKEAKS